MYIYTRYTRILSPTDFTTMAIFGWNWGSNHPSIRLLPKCLQCPTDEHRTHLG